MLGYLHATNQMNAAMLTRTLLLTAFSLSLVALPAAAQTHNYNSGSEPEPLSRDADSDLTPPPAAQPMPAPSPTDIQIRIQNLEAQVRNMNGIVEAVQYRNQQLEAALQRMASDDGVRFQMLEKRIADQDAAAKAAAAAPATPAVDPAVAATVKADADAVAAKTPAKAETKTETAKTETEAPATDTPAAGTEKTLGTERDAQALYEQGFKSISEAKYDLAEKEFKSFLTAYPKNRLTENAKYWLAESYYARSRFQEAAIAFAETFKQFPNGSKAPDNLLKLALSLGALNNKEDACKTLGELKNRYPGASALIRARAEQEKKSLSCT